MKTIDDALELKRRIFGAFEMAEVAPTPAEKQEWLTIVVVGAGPTGVEIAGQIRELASRSLRGEFRTFDPGGGARAARRRRQGTAGDLRPPSVASRRPRAREARRRAHDGREGHQHRRVRRRRQGQRRYASTSPRTPWCGPRACRRRRSPRSSRRRPAPSVDRAGHIAPLPDLTLPGHPEVFVVGDMVTLDKLPGVAEVAMQGSLHAGEHDRPPSPGRRRSRTPSATATSAASRPSAASGPCAASGGSG